MYKSFSFDNFLVYVNTANGEIEFFKKKEYSDTEIRQYLSTSLSFNRSQIKFEYSSHDYLTMTLAFNITNRCNLNCRYCFQQEKSVMAMPFDLVKSEIERFVLMNKNKKNIFIDLSGSGEPLLELNNVLQISRLCQNLKAVTGVNVIVQFVCNGTLLSEDVSEILQKELVLFGCSLDGTPEYHNRNRITLDGKPTYDVIVKNLKMIKMNDFVGTSMVLDESFDGDVLECYLNMRNYSKTISIKFKRFMEMPTFCANFERIIIGYEKTAQYILSKAAVSDFTLFFSILNGDDVFGTIISRVFIGNKVFSRCDAGVGRIAYDSKGLRFPCIPATMISELRFNTAGSNPVFDTIKKIDYCHNCEAKYYCGGECPIVKYHLGNNDIYLCKIKKKLFELSLQIKISFVNMKEGQNEIVENFILSKENRWNNPLEYS
jgi:uncharacterized protein